LGTARELVVKLMQPSIELDTYLQSSQRKADAYVARLEPMPPACDMGAWMPESKKGKEQIYYMVF